MASCAYCGSTILFGGKQDGDLRFCNDGCRQKGALIRFSQQVPPEVVEQFVETTRSGNCPLCGGRGPVDVHTSYRVWSALLLTSWASRPRICCRSCGTKAKLGDTLFCLTLGWWGFPWGLIFTPVQLCRNLIGIALAHDGGKPSEQFHKIARVQVAALYLEQQRQAQGAGTNPGSA